MDLLRRREILQLAKDNVRQHVEILDSQKERVELGAGSSADVTQTKGRLARAQSTLTDAEASLREGEASYIRLTGKPVPASLAEVYVPEPMYTGYDAVMEVADKNNPKLKAYICLLDTSCVDGLKMSDYGITKEDMAKCAANARHTMGGLFELDPYALSLDETTQIMMNAYK